MTTARKKAAIISIILLFAAIPTCSVIFLASQIKQQETLSQRVQYMPHTFYPFAFTITEQRGTVLGVRLDFYTLQGTIFSARNLVLQGTELFMDLYHVPVIGTSKYISFPAALYTEIPPNVVKLGGMYTDSDGYPAIYSGYPFTSAPIRQEMTALFKGTISGHRYADPDINPARFKSTIHIRNYATGVSYFCAVNTETGSAEFTQGRDERALQP